MAKQIFRGFHNGSFHECGDKPRAPSWKELAAERAAKAAADAEALRLERAKDDAERVEKIAKNRARFDRWDALPKGGRIVGQRLPAKSENAGPAFGGSNRYAILVDIDGQQRRWMSVSLWWDYIGFNGRDGIDLSEIDAPGGEPGLLSEATSRRIREAMWGNEAVPVFEG